MLMPSFCLKSTRLFEVMTASLFASIASWPVKNVEGVISVLLGGAAFIIYWRSIYKGQTRPHPVSHLIWATLTLTAACLQMCHGGGAGAWSALAMGCGYAITALWASMTYKASLTKSDLVIIVLAMMAVVVWLCVGRPIVSVILVGMGSLCGFVPTLKKVWHAPYGEDLVSVTVNSLRSIVAILAIHKMNFVTLFYPLFSLTLYAAFISLCVARRRVFNKVAGA